MCNPVQPHPNFESSSNLAQINLSDLFKIDPGNLLSHQNLNTYNCSAFKFNTVEINHDQISLEVNNFNMRVFHYVHGPRVIRDSLREVDFNFNKN